MKHLLHVLIILACFSCVPPQENEQQMSIDIEEELKAIEATRTAFITALKEGRISEIGNLTSPDVKTIRAGGSGWDEMFALGAQRGRFPYDSIIMMPTETFILNDSMAYDWGSSKVYYTNADGNPVELRNSFLVIMKKVEGQWKLHREVASSVLE